MSKPINEVSQLETVQQIHQSESPLDAYATTSRNQSSFERWVKPKSFNCQYPSWVSSNALMAITSFYSSLGDLLFGFDQGIVGGLLVNHVFLDRFFADYMDASGEIRPVITGITVGCLQLSAGFAALTCGRLCDMLGRRWCMRIGGSIYFGAAFIQAFAPSLGVFICGRTIQGLGVGFLSMTVPVIQTEIASMHKRGMMVGIEFTFNIIGYAISCWIDYAFYFSLPSNISWQGPYFVQAGMAFVLVVLSIFVPETPRWLAANGFPDESLQTVANLHGNGNIKDKKVLLMYNEIMEAVNYESTLGSVSWTEMFTTYRRRTFQAMTGQMFAQLNGINVISFYLATSLYAAGFTTEKALLYTGYNSIVYIFATVPTWWLADRWGRRPILMSGSIAMIIALSMVCMFTQIPATVVSTATKGYGIFAFVVIYNAIFGYSWGPVPWLLPAEVFPLRARAKGMSLATVANWTFNFAIGMSTPAAFASMHGYYYLLIAGFCFISLLMVKFLYIETAGCTLEEIAIQFGDRAFEDQAQLENKKVEMEMEFVSQK
ncbi:putative MFS sugar transporter [Taphrina deformans PYCC 5710]|uniref:MFS sugar transporter n=1 Tax=Taphrina deformans (strain PYCC 5710 / ATCC 11124 / CBS 356.35 / IMI 108563 / JCM 9778 / NBRC 8474) TaxID=1097556 RepID=R4XJB4_TAPDE|nr:putative MFS sugar transporter [Taphrina deformans PYCC 5710]|eukprot:CCG83450.1 putative MFS sugar transporter [Taphrina deformans PYCC 5710]